MNGVRKWHPANTSSYTVALASAKQLEAALLTEKEIAPKPSPEAPKFFEELRAAFIHDKKTTFKKDGSPLHADTITHYEQVTRVFLDTIQRKMPSQVTKQDLKDWIAAQRLRVSHRWSTPQKCKKHTIPIYKLQIVLAAPVEEFWVWQKYNSFMDYPATAMKLRRAATPELASLIQDALRRRNQLATYARREIYRELALYLQSEISPFPDELVERLSDEQYLTNASGILFGDQRRSRVQG